MWIGNSNTKKTLVIILFLYLSSLPSHLRTFYHICLKKTLPISIQLSLLSITVSGMLRIEGCGSGETHNPAG